MCYKLCELGEEGASRDWHLEASRRAGERPAGGRPATHPGAAGEGPQGKTPPGAPVTASKAPVWPCGAGRKQGGTAERASALAGGGALRLG